MKTFDDIMMIEFNDRGVVQVAIFNKHKISEKEVKEFIAKMYPLGFDYRIIFTSRQQFTTVFG